MQILETSGDIFFLPQNEKEALCITTNGITKKNGDAVMGAGIAKACAQAFPYIPKRLGMLLKNTGNHVYFLGLVKYDCYEYCLFNFPTKNDWRENSDIELIRQSCSEIVKIVDMMELTRVYIPQPGCTNGHLDWESQVKPAIENLLDSRFTIVIRR